MKDTLLMLLGLSSMIVGITLIAEGLDTNAPWWMFLTAGILLGFSYGLAWRVNG